MSTSRTYTMDNGSTWTTQYHAPPSVQMPAPRPVTMDDLNAKIITLETRLNSSLSMIETLNKQNIVLTELIEYMKEVFDEEFKPKE